MKRGKKYKNIKELIEKNKKYSLNEAIEFFKKSNYNFDRSINLYLQIANNSKKNKKNINQNLKGVIFLPHGNGIQKKVLVITEQIDLAKEAGADIVGGKKLINEIATKKEFPKCDVIIATEDLMPNVIGISSILKQFTPNPKNGTIVKNEDLSKVIKELKCGNRIEYRLDKEGCVMLSFAKMSFEFQKIKENFDAVLESILPKQNLNFNNKNNLKIKIFITATMSPSVKISLEKK